MKKGNYRMLVRNLREMEDAKCSEQFYCFNKQNKKLDKCLKQCSTCESMKLMQ